MAGLDEMRLRAGTGVPASPVRSARPLSIRQADALRFIAAYVAEYGHPPTLREIAEGIGLSGSSTNFAHQIVQALATKGFVSHRAGCARGLRILRPCPTSAAGSQLRLNGKRV